MFLPISKQSTPFDFVLLTADAYVDHPSFGASIIARLVESRGFSVGIIAQPTRNKDYLRLGQPNIAFLVSGGVCDSMVNNYTASLALRKGDEYSESGIKGKRPDRALTVYCQNLRRLFGDVCIIIGGIEASLRRLSHYDYWTDKVRPSILVETDADLLVYGMGERPMLELLKYAERGVPLSKIKDVKGTAYKIKSKNEKTVIDGVLTLPSHDEVCQDKKKYAEAFMTAFSEATGTGSDRPQLLRQETFDGYNIIVNPPSIPLTQAEMDEVYALPYERTSHPMYTGGIPALEEVEHSITAHRGCYGGCSFCALTYHQGKTIQSRSLQSVVAEGERIVGSSTFKGYIHDVGGPSANFHTPPCGVGNRGQRIEDRKQCNRNCIGYKPCGNLKVDHSEYLTALRAVSKINGVKKVFIRSGIRYDYLMMDKPQVLDEIVKNHVSGQLKVAPEHNSENVLRLMNKPSFAAYKKFVENFETSSRKVGLKQFLVPYFVSSHPGCTLEDAYKLMLYLKEISYMPLQVQDFYPTPSTLSTTMYYCGFDPRDGKPVYVAKTKKEKAMQRALLQWRLPKNRGLIAEAEKLIKAKGERKNTQHNRRRNNKKKQSKTNDK